MTPHRHLLVASAPRRLAAVVLVVAALVPILTWGAPAGAQSTELDRARRAAQAAAGRVSDAETELGELDGELAVLEQRTQAAEARLASLRGSIEELVIRRYTTRGDMPLLASTDINRGVKAEALSRYVSQGSFDSIDAFTEARAELDESTTLLTSRRQAQAAALERLRDALADVKAELAKVEAADARRRAAAARAAGTRSTGSRAAPVLLSGGGMVCPVGGSTSFVDTWGAPRSGGRRHKGVDMMAARGTPVVAPVAGFVTHRGNSVGGLSFHLMGSNGHYYYGTHLSGYAAGGQVSAGTVIGYVGDTGNARGIPHLHFEIHPNNGAAVNPYPATRAACG